MKIICNGEERWLEKSTSIGGYIRVLGINPDSVVVEYNGEILSKEEHDSRLIEEGATLELIRFVGGG
jgi:sulfur carrier protein